MSLKICVMKSRGTIAPYIMSDIAEALEHAGHKVLLIDMEKEGFYSELPQPALKDMIINNINKIRNFAPDFAFSYGAGGIIATGNQNENPASNLFEDLKIPYVLFMFDGPLSVQNALRELSSSSLVRILCWDSTHIQRLETTGLKNIRYFPLGVNTRKFNKEVKRENWKQTISFVGSINSHIIENGFAQVPDLAMFQKLFIAVKMSSPCRPFTELWKIMEKQIPEERLASYKRFKDSPTFPNFLSDTIQLADTEYRLRFVSNAGNIAPNGIHVYGNDAWRKFSFPEIHYSGPVEYGSEIENVYSDSKINLNLTMSHLISAVNQRVFDVSASGGFLLTDYRQDIETLFPRGLVPCFRNESDMKTKIDYFLSRDKERVETAKALQEHTLRNHSWDVRVKTLINEIL